MNEVTNILLAGVLVWSQVSSSNRWISGTWLGQSLATARSRSGNPRYGYALIEPELIHLPGGDSDGDGLANAWEHLHFGSVDGPGPGEDTDGDRASNLHEYVAGTDPADAASQFAATAAGSTGGTLVISWPSAADRTYSLFRSTAGPAGFTPLAQGLAPTPPENVYTDTVDAIEGALYRVEVEAGP